MMTTAGTSGVLYPRERERDFALCNGSAVDVGPVRERIPASAVIVDARLRVEFGPSPAPMPSLTRWLLGMTVRARRH